MYYDNRSGIGLYIRQRYNTIIMNGRSAKKSAFGLWRARVAGKKKMIIRPSDNNKKVSKLKKSVIEFRENATENSEKLLDLKSESATVQSVKSASFAAEAANGSPRELRSYERLRQNTDHETLTEVCALLCVKKQ